MGTGSYRAYSTLEPPQRLMVRGDNASIFLARDFIKTAKRLNITHRSLSLDTLLSIMGALRNSLEPLSKSVSGSISLKVLRMRHYIQVD